MRTGGRPAGAAGRVHYGAMAGAESVWGEAARWYPQVVAVGDACSVCQAEFYRQGMPLRVRPRVGVNPHRRTTVENGELHADLLLSPWQRRFYRALRIGRSTLLRGYPADPATAAGAARLWLSGARPGQVAAARPFLDSVARTDQHHCHERLIRFPYRRTTRPDCSRAGRRRCAFRGRGYGLGTLSLAMPLPQGSRGWVPRPRWLRSPGPCSTPRSTWPWRSRPPRCPTTRWAGTTPTSPPPR
jgi:hypothetical protein